MMELLCEAFIDWVVIILVSFGVCGLMFGNKIIVLAKAKVSFEQKISGMNDYINEHDVLIDDLQGTIRTMQDQINGLNEEIDGLNGIVREGEALR